MEFGGLGLNETGIWRVIFAPKQGVPSKAVE